MLTVAGFFAVAALLTGCADPTEGVSEARVNAPAQAPTEQANAGAEAEETEAEATAHAAESAAVPMAVAAAAPPAEAAVVTYTLTDDSVIGFEGYKVTGSHIGGFGTFDGKVVVPENDLALAHIGVTIDMASTYSDDAALTDKLKGPDFFDVEQFPESRFESTAIEPTGDGYLVSGNLTLHGVTQNISFPAQITIDREGLVAEAEFTINRMDFGIEYPGMADDLVKEKVVIRLDVEGAPGA